MPFSIYSNEPSPLNSTFMGYLVNSFREILTRKVDSGSPGDKIANRFLYSAAMVICSFPGSIGEGVARIGLSIGGLPILQLLPDRFENMYRQNIKSTLIALKLFFVSANPLSLSSLIALSLLPQAYNHTAPIPNPDMLQRCSDNKKPPEIGSLAKLAEFSSFLDDSWSGKKINKAREAQTDYEISGSHTFFEIRFARLLTHLACLSLGLAASVESLEAMICIITYSLYLFSVSNSQTQSFLKITPEAFAEKLNYLELLTRQALTALFIFSDTINPISQILTCAQAAIDDDAYNVPKETLKIVRPELFRIGGFTPLALPVAQPEPVSHDWGTDQNNPFLSS